MTPNLRSNNRSLLAPTRWSGLLQAGLMVGLVLVLAWLVMISGPSESSAAPVSQARPLLLVAPPGSTATPTPFQPLPPTPTYQPTDFVYPTPTPLPFTPQAAPVTGGQSKTWADYPGPIIWPDVQVPPPVGILPQPEGQVNILLLGSDQRPYDSGFRTDTIILLTIDPAAGTANMTSFPRDLYVYIPGWTVQRINTAFGYGGFEALAQTFEYNFGVRPDHYAVVNLWSFEDMIDSLGGLRVDVGRDLCDHRDNWGMFCVSQSTMWMNGKTVLWYVRSRYSTSDFDRGRRQQEVVVAGLRQLISIDGIRRAPELYEIYRQNVLTDMTLDDITPFFPLAIHLNESSQIYHYYIGPEQVTGWTNYSGAQVLLPIQESVMTVMHQALNSP
ncbi:MAG TPA: LCP family protein [Anaerolineales bacterium]|nr:LCP family protein [Anaerolineales bacterium]